MKTKVLTYRVIIEEDGNCYHGFVPSLPGCHTQGKTIDETRKNLRDAIEGYIKSLIKHKELIPLDKGYETTETIHLKNLPSGVKLSYV